ncbi:MAG: trypsin-like serine protease [Pseudomonadota bacterium]
MKRPALATSLLVMVALASCDAVRIPGQDRDTGTPGGESVTQPAPPSETPDTTVDPDPVIPEPDPVSQIDPEPETQPAAIVTDLASINTVACGLELTEDAEPTITIAALNTQLSNDEDDAPQAESLFQTSVAGAVTAVNFVQTLDAFPGIVKMQPVERMSPTEFASGHCGATRISDNWFITAAHCIEKPYDEIQFIAGTVNLDSLENATTFNGANAFCHSGYTGQDTSMVNDIALVRVDDDIVPALTSIPIASYGRPDELLSPVNYQTARMAGWGSTRHGSLPSDELLTTDLELVTASPGVILVKSTGIGPCQGDSGGPLYVTEEDGQQTVVGVLSNVRAPSTQVPCSGTYLSAYTNVGGYVDWVEALIAACEANDGLCD